MVEDMERHMLGMMESLESESLGDRVLAIQVLEETGDQADLIRLREQLNEVSRENESLIIVVGKLKRRSGVQ